MRFQLSKALARALRHTAADRGVVVRADGFVKVAELLDLREFRSLACTSADVCEAVRTNDKKRFNILQEEDGSLFIRAVQGHSMAEVEDDSLLKKLSPNDPDLPLR